MKSKSLPTHFTVQGRVSFVRSDAALELATGEIRGQEYIIVPCSMLVEGVLHSSNASDPALALASEFGAIPQGWDGRPVVYNHPSVDGQAVSANRPDGWNNEAIGYVFNSRMDRKKLLSDLWLDTSRAPQVLLDGVKSGQEFEVSTGLFALAEETSGYFNSQRYAMIWRNVVPDHLAVLEPGSVGACSIADGCGTPRNNQSLHSNAKVYMLPAQNRESGISSLAAKANTNEVAASPGDCECSGSTDQGAPFANRLKSIPRAMQLAFNKFIGRFTTNELSDNDVRRALSVALAEMDGYAYASVEAVFSSTVVFSAMNRADYEWHMYQVAYTVVEGGAISLGASPVEVRPETSYVPVVVGTAVEDAPLPLVSNQEDTAMDLSKDQMTALAAAVAVANTANAAAAQPAVVQPTTSADKIGLTSSLPELLANASPELASSITAAMNSAAAASAAMVDKLKANGYTPEELVGVSPALLSKMVASLARPVTQEPGAGAAVDYSANGAQAVAQPITNFTAPTRVFPLKAA